MADELTVTAGLNYVNTGVSMAVPAATDKITVSANFAIRSIYTVDSAAGANLPLGSIAAPGYIIIKNTDAANFVLVGNAGDALPIRINAGEYALFRFSTGIVPFVIADTSDVVIDYMLVSD